jgi:beta-ribofuranosylaminobenzene 5'-phosphate synthase
MSGEPSVDARPSHWHIVRAPARLHFGLVVGAGNSSLPAIGGAGVMIDAPATIVRARHAAEWSAAGPEAEAALAIARTLNVPACTIVVEAIPLRHAGLGSGTQLALAVAHAVLAATGVPAPGNLVARLGRGARSGIGAQGFYRGGFLADAGKTSLLEAPDVAIHQEFPASWRILVAVPRQGKGLHGDPEKAAFARLSPAERSQAEELSKLVREEMVHGLARHDLRQFGEAVYEFNRRVGEQFAGVQGGVYAHSFTADAVKWFRRHGLHGTGQSSWGPATFAIVEQERADWLLEQARRVLGLGDADCICARASESGAIASKAS